MLNKLFLIGVLLIFISCENKKSSSVEKSLRGNVEVIEENPPTFTQHEAENLLKLPIACFSKPYPYKLGQTLESAADLKEPKELHPVFYGCFDWHSAVHGYWSMLTLIKNFPEMEKAEEVKNILKTNITKENILIEAAYFEKDINKSFERMYGWAWLLKLAEELHTWNDPIAQELEANLQPLTDIIIMRYKEFLPKLEYPIRVGEHTNTAFGLTYAYDYAITTGETELAEIITRRAKDFYSNDVDCPIDWEPSGYDFLSPCFEEINIMRRVLSSEEFLIWLDQFMPELKDKSYQLQVGKVSDRTDGKLVHLDGLNFSRAWSLYALANQYEAYSHLKNTAHLHMNYSLPNLVEDSYEGGHWLGSFAIYALIQNKDQ